MSLPKKRPVTIRFDRYLPAHGMLKRSILVICMIMVILAVHGGYFAAWSANGDHLSQDAVWVPADGPHVIEKDLTIPAGITLTIKPGSEVLLGKGSSLIVEGKLLAVGTIEDPILFTSRSPQPAAGDWGSLRFVTADTTLSYDEEGNYVKGSRLEHCIVEYGGKPGRKTPKEFLGGAIHCRKSSPYLKNLIVRFNSSLQGGGVYCHEFASPYISGCLFKENRAAESGGGLACFFYSNAVVKDNIFHANQAGQHGGGIYFSFSSPQIINNIIENNTAAVHGGGLYCSNTVTQSISRVRNNVLLSNRSNYKANSIYITAKIETIFQGNCFLAGEGYDVYVDALEKDLDLRGNYFGPPSKSDLEARIYDSYDDPTQLSVIFDPVLESPPPELPNAPKNISSFEIMGDEAYSSDWPLPLCDGAPVYLEVRAQDNNPYHPDWIPVRLRSSVSDPKGLVALAWETGPSTGIFRLRGEVASITLPNEAKIKARPGETLFCSIEGVEGFEVVRPIDSPKSYITVLRLPEEVDTLHVVSHQPILSWTYRDIFERKQESFQIQISDGVPFSAPPAWDSGERLGSRLGTSLREFELIDGMTYGLRLRIFNGSQWSDWADLTMRMNSLPTVPEPQSPQYGKIINQIRPAITLKASTDAEGDEVFYEIQLYQDPEFKRVLGIEKELKAKGGLVSWTAPADLTDDAEYYWRARARDAYETGPWSETGQFWVNLIEEPPLPFGLLDPEIGGEIYQLQPVFSWEETFDPDPLSSVRYRLFYSRNPQFTPASTLMLETEMTFIKALKLLKNEETYYWKVVAVDNSGRSTQSDQIGSFFVNTTPSVPQIVGPIAGQELSPEDMITWNPSHDPDPDDQIQYRLQIAAQDFTAPLVEDILEDAGATLKLLDQYDQLTDNTEYRFRVRAEDNHGIFSKWAESQGFFFFNKVNDPPSVVQAPISPEGGVITDVNPTFSWGAAHDADRSDPPEKISYLIQFDQDADFVEGVRQVQIMAGITRVAVPGLADNQEWFYRICARDDDGAVSEWCPTKRFILNTQNDPPLPFSLNSPSDGMETYKLGDIEFTWEAARDPDPMDSLCYHFHLALASDESQIVSEQKTKETAWLLTSTLENEVEYLWWVEAEDLAGQRTSSTQKFHFRVNTTPSVPQPIPIAGGVITGGEALYWAPSTDPDPNDLLTYEMRIVSPEDPDNSLLELKDISAVKASNGIPVESLEGLGSLADNLPYSFQVRAKDQHDAVSAWSSPASFYLDLVNEPPAAPVLLEPAEELTRETEITVRWTAASDADPSDKPESMTYRLQVAPGENFASEDISERATLSGAHSLVDLQLADNQLWSLRVRAEDVRGGISEWSSPVQLLVNVAEDPPSPPEILGPAAESTFLTTQPVVLSWSESHDPDYASSISYEVRCWPQDETENVTSWSALSNTTLTLEGLPGDRDYNWQVLARDETGLETVSEVGSFRVEVPNNPPQPFALLAPEDGQVELPTLFEFSWEAARDDDPGDEVRYTLYIAEDPFFNQGVRIHSDLNETGFTLIKPLQEGMTYYWKVVAEDRRGLQTWGSSGDKTASRFSVGLPSQIQDQSERLR